jgi:hypothetical protein
VIDFRVCKKCRYGNWEPPKRGGDGQMIVKPSVGCLLDGSILLMTANPPVGCPHSLEHKLCTQYVPLEFAKEMSGETVEGDEL